VATLTAIEKKSAKEAGVTEEAYAATKAALTSRRPGKASRARTRFQEDVMTALAKDRNTKHKSKGPLTVYKVAAGVVIYVGSLVAKNAAGFLVPRRTLPPDRRRSRERQVRRDHRQGRQHPRRER
jgi:hypothetical protein